MTSEQDKDKKIKKKDGITTRIVPAIKTPGKKKSN